MVSFIAISITWVSFIAISITWTNVKPIDIQYSNLMLVYKQVKNVEKPLEKSMVTPRHYFQQNINTA